MSADPGFAGGGAGTGEPSEEELRAAYEAEIKRLRVEHLLLEHVVTMINVGMRRTGLSPGTEDERDPTQVRLAIESVRVLMPLLEQTAPEQVGQIRSALSQLQLAFVRIGGQAPASSAGQPDSAAPDARTPPAGTPREPATPDPPKPGEPGPAQRTGRLWVPGQ